MTEADPRKSTATPVPAGSAGPVGAGRPHRQASTLNIANALTVFRIVLVPFFLAALFVDGGNDTGWRITAWGVFAAAMITDRIDGQVARKFHLITDFGKLLDPIADKLLIGSALIGLSILGELWWPATIIILAREFGITLWRFLVISDGVVAANRGGKLKTALQTLAVGLYVLPLPGVFDIPLAILMAATVAITVLTGIDYLRAARMPHSVPRTAP